MCTIYIKNYSSFITFISFSLVRNVKALSANRCCCAYVCESRMLFRRLFVYSKKNVPFICHFGMCFVQIISMLMRYDFVQNYCLTMLKNWIRPVHSILASTGVTITYKIWSLTHSFVACFKQKGRVWFENFSADIYIIK